MKSVLSRISDNLPVTVVIYKLITINYNLSVLIDNEFIK